MADFISTAKTASGLEKLTALKELNYTGIIPLDIRPRAIASLTIPILRIRQTSLEKANKE